MAKLFLPTATVVNTAKFPDLPGVYIGREWAGRACSPWANPFTVGQGRDTPERRREVVWQYVVKLMDSPQRFQLEELRGESLMCWCLPGLCHGTALAFLLAQKQLHGLPCTACGQPQASILNLWVPDPKWPSALVYEFAKCPCGYYHFNHRAWITPETFEAWAAGNARQDEGALDQQPTFL